MSGVYLGSRNKERWFDCEAGDMVVEFGECSFQAGVVEVTCNYKGYHRLCGLFANGSV